MRLRNVGGGDETYVLGDAPCTVGSGNTADFVVTIPGVAPLHVRIAGRVIEALAPCLVGDVPLEAGRKRLLVPGIAIQLGAATLVVEPKDEDGLETRELAFRALASPSPLSPTVVVVEGVDRGKRLALRDRRTYTLGRSDACDLALNETSVSRCHLDLEVTAAGILVRDLDAKGGTFLGSSRLAPGRRAVWPARTMLRVGHVVLALTLPDGWEAVEEPPASIAPSSIGESVPSLRIATSACEAGVAEIPQGPPARVRSPRSMAQLLVPALLALFIAAAMGLLVYLIAA